MSIIKSIHTSSAEALNYSNALDFHDGADTDVEYEYDSNGALARDDNRGINSITYDYGHHPSYINMNTNQGRKPDGKLMKYIINEKGNHCIITFNVDLPSDENSPNYNSYTTTSIKEKKENENSLNVLWGIISKYLK